MKSHEVIRKAVEEPGVKAVAAALKVSAALVYKWCEAVEGSDPEISGVRNPLDRVKEMYTLTKDPALINWLCHEAGGFYVPNPKEMANKTFDESIFVETRGMVREFSELLDTVTESVENDQQIDAREAVQIRGRWEDLKSCLERFVVACERGVYLKRGKKD